MAPPSSDSPTSLVPRVPAPARGPLPGAEPSRAPAPQSPARRAAAGEATRPRETDALSTSSAVGDALALGRALLGVPILRLAGTAPQVAEDTTATDLDAWFAPGDDVAQALLTEVQQLAGVLVVEDSRAAAPLHGIPVVDGVRVMACVAAPLRSTEGSIDAALCALDGVPRWWGERDLELIARLARVIEGLRTSPGVLPRGAGSVALGSTALLDAVGRLAGGVAHDFNNLLTVIAANAELLRHDGAAEHAGSRELREIERAARQAGELTWRLLAFSRQLPASPERLAVHPWLVAEEAELQALLPAGTRLEFALRANAPEVHVDPELLRHAVRALVQNASDAMRRGGVIHLETARVVLEHERAGVPDAVPAGEWVCLTVVDAGDGIAPDVLAQVFEPFFTTRGVARGKGLGLPVAHGIIAQAGGRCTIESVDRQGTRVQLWVPASSRR